MPRINSVVHVYGICKGVNCAGVLQIAIESLSFNVRMLLTSSAPGPPTPQLKRCKFNATANVSCQLAHAKPRYAIYLFFHCEFLFELISPNITTVMHVANPTLNVLAMPVPFLKFMILSRRNQ